MVKIKNILMIRLAVSFMITILIAGTVSCGNSKKNDTNNRSDSIPELTSVSVTSSIPASNTDDNTVHDNINLSSTENSTPIGSPKKYRAMATYSDGSSRDVTTSSLWTSGSINIATINNKSGIAVGVAMGTTVITAHYIPTGSGEIINNNSPGKSGSANMIVSDKTLQSITVTPLTASIPSGFSQRFLAMGDFSDGTRFDITNSVNWISSDTTIAIVQSPGIVTAKATGIATITATFAGKSSTAKMTVLSTTLMSIAVKPLLTQSVPIGFLYTYVAIGVFSDGTSLDISSDATWTSSNSAIAIVVEPGVVKSVFYGKASISASFNNNVGVATHTVYPATLQSIYVKPIRISVPSGFTQRFIAVGAFSDGSSLDISHSVTWSSSDTNFAKIISPGIATSIRNGTAIITAELGDKSGSASLIVMDAILNSILVTPTESSVPIGGILRFKAIGSFSDGTSFDISNSVYWSTKDFSIASVDSKGFATGKLIGTTTIKATLGDKTGSATLSVSHGILTSISIVPTTYTIPLGFSQTFIAIGSFSDGTSQDISNMVIWSSDAITVAIIETPGFATSLMVGTATITASSGSKSASANLIVKAAALSSISITPAIDFVSVGLSKSFVAIGSYSDGTSLDISNMVQWNSRSNAIATIISPGISTGVSQGTTIITATSGSKIGSATLTVKTATLNSIAVTSPANSIQSGQSQNYVAIGSYSDGTSLDISNLVIWRSSNLTVASIVDSGIANGLSIGSTTISATSGEMSSSINLEVQAAALSSIIVTSTSYSISSGLSQTFVAIGSYTDGSSLDISNSVLWTSSNNAVATVSSSRATGVSVGTALITANSGSFSGSATLTVTSKILNSIAVTPLTASRPSGLTQGFIAMGSYSDGSSQDISNTVVWSSNNIAVATVLSPGTATGVSVGTALITATSGLFSGSATLTVTAAILSSVAITPLTVSKPKGLTQNFIATGSYSDGSTFDISNMVVWSSSNIAIATVLSPGTATGVAVGTTLITATSGLIFNSATLTVTAATLTSISLSPLTASRPSGLTQNFIATGSYSDGSTLDISNTVVWTSSNIAIGTVLSPGTATGVSVGTTSIIATSGLLFNSATLTVTAATLSSIAVTPLTVSKPSGLTQNFIATGSYSDGTTLDISNTVAWTSGNIAIATVVSPGTATGVSVGTALITATSGLNFGSASLTVTAAILSSITVTPLTASKPSGLTQNFIATGSYSDGSSLDITNTVVWTSGNNAVATIVSTGTATGISVGTALITATSGLFASSATLTVSAATLSTIAVTPLTVSKPSGLTQDFIATGSYSDGSTLDISNTVVWTSGNIAVATVVSPGTATGVSIGTALITATSGLYFGSATLTVTAAILNSIAVTPLSASKPSGLTQDFIATGSYSDGSTLDISNTVIWTSDNIVVATVVSPGTTTGQSVGVAMITATSGLFSDSGTMTVTAATLSFIEVTPLTVSRPKGLTQDFIAIGFYSDGSSLDISNLVVWTSGTIAVATIVSPGTATGLSVGSTLITATSGSKSDTATLTVTAATLSSIVVTPASATIMSGNTQAFVAMGTYSDASIVDITNIASWTSDDIAVATVVSTGVATGVSLGSASITATSGGVSDSAILTVAVPLGPAPVPLGTAINFVILTKTGITDAVPASLSITGNIGSSPITSAAMNTIPCSQIAGSIIGVDAGYTGGACYTASAGNKTLVDNAVLDMESAFTNAAGRPTPDFTGLGSGDISGMTLAPGLYKWATGVLVSSSGVILDGGPNDVWIFQIGVDLTINNNAIITLSGGAQAKNVFWQVSGQATLGTATNFKGIILSQTQITLNTTTAVSGRLLSQTAVTLQGNMIAPPP